MHPVLAVKKGNPKSLRTLEDLLKDGVHIAQTNESAAVGKLTKGALEKAGYWDKLASRTPVTFQLTVNDVANAVKLGTVDGGIVWDITVRQFDGLEAIQLPVFNSVDANITLGVLRSANDPAAATASSRKATSPPPTRASRCSVEKGYTIVSGDKWTEVPGSGLLAGRAHAPPRN